MYILASEISNHFNKSIINPIQLVNNRLLIIL